MMLCIYTIKEPFMTLILTRVAKQTGRRKVLNQEKTGKTRGLAQGLRFERQCV